MLHLNPERLAALADDEPTAEEARHLIVCTQCEGERRAQMALFQLARDTGSRGGVALTEWEPIARELRARGQIVAPDLTLARPARERRLASESWWMRAAAAVLLLVSGVGVGRWTAPPVAAEQQSSAVANVDSAGAFESPRDARAALARAEQNYRNAVAYLVQHDSSSQSLGTPATYRARLAALDERAGAARRGVDEAPYDPLLSQYYLSTLAARQVTLQQLGATLPSGVRLTQF
jgi:hypothetical protein